MINASLQGLDLLVVRKQFLDHGEQFFRFEETLPDDLPIQVIPQLTTGKTNEKIDFRLFVFETESNSGTKKTIRGHLVTKISVRVFYYGR